MTRTHRHKHDGVRFLAGQVAWAPAGSTPPTVLDAATVARIQQVHDYPAVSVLMSADSNAETNCLRLERLLDVSETRLLNEFTRPEVQTVLDALDGLTAGTDLGSGHQGFALFVSHDLALVVALPFSVRDRVVIDETFATRDLVHALLRSPRYRVLVLGEYRTRLFAGLGTSLSELLDHGFPHHASSEPGREQPRFGIDRSAARDNRLRRYIRDVDKALGPHLRDDVPLLVVGAGRRLSMFSRLSRHRGRISDTLSGALERQPAADVARLVDPAVARILLGHHHEALAELDRAIGTRRCAFGIQQAWALIHEGRGALLAVEENYTYPGRVDPSTNALTPASDIEHPEVIDDVVDEIIEIVLAKSGRVAILPDGVLANRGRMTLTLRH